MTETLARKLFGTSNERRIRAYSPRVAEINALETELEQLSDEALRARTDMFKKEVADGKDSGVKSLQKAANCMSCHKVHKGS